MNGWAEHANSKQNGTRALLLWGTNHYSTVQPSKNWKHNLSISSLNKLQLLMREEKLQDFDKMLYGYKTLPQCDEVQKWQQNNLSHCVSWYAHVSRCQAWSGMEHRAGSRANPLPGSVSAQIRWGFLPRCASSSAKDKGRLNRCSPYLRTNLQTYRPPQPAHRHTPTPWSREEKNGEIQ